MSLPRFALLFGALIALGGCQVLRPNPVAPVDLIKLESDAALLPDAQMLTPALAKVPMPSFGFAPFVLGNALWVADASGNLSHYRDQSLIYQVNVGALASGVAVSPDGRLLVAGTQGGEVIGIDASTGEVLWRVAMGAGVSRAQVTHEGIYFQSQNGALIKLNHQGATVWVSSMPTKTARLGMEAPIFIEDSVVFGTGSGYLSAHNTQTGVQVWTRSVGTSHGANPIDGLRDVVASPLVAGNVLVATSLGGVAAFDLSSGETLFENPNIASARAPIFVGKVWFVIARDGVLHRIDGQGNALSSTNALLHRKPTNIIAFARAGQMYAVVGDVGGVLHVFDAQGNVVSRKKIANRPLVSLSEANGTLYAFTDLGALYALALTN